MIESIINMDISELEKCNDARSLYLYLYHNNGKNIEFISNKILETGNLQYIHFLLRTFEIDKYDKFINYILNNSDSPEYLFNILYEVEYLDDNTKIKIINKIIKLNNYRYIMKAIYYYFNVLKLYDENTFNNVKEYIKNNLNITINNHNYLEAIDKLFYKEDYEYDYEGFSKNYYKGRKNYIPNIIVCHINNTYSSAINRFYNEDKVSAHYVIRRDGYVKQVVSLDDSAWANGTSLSEESDRYYKFSTSNIIKNIEDNANYCTFSIEHESFDGSLTDEQLESSINVMKEIIKYLKDKYDYDFIIDREHIIGHNEVNPITRKKCPGKNFPFDKIIKELRIQI